MRTQRSADSMGAGILLIGLGLVFLLRHRIDFLPWVLAVIAVARVPAALAGDGGWNDWQAPFWLLGLAILFGTGMLWPGILVLAGVSMLLRAAAAKVVASEEQQLADEPVTVAPIPSVTRSAPPPVPDEGDVNADEASEGVVGEVWAPARETSPLSSADLQALEQELVGQIEGETQGQVPAPEETPVAKAESEPETPWVDRADDASDDAIVQV